MGMIDWLRKNVLNLGDSYPEKANGRVGLPNALDSGAQPEPNEYWPVERDAQGRMFRTPPEGLRPGLGRGADGRLFNTAVRGQQLMGGLAQGLTLADLVTTLGAQLENDRLAARDAQNGYPHQQVPAGPIPKVMVL